MIMQKIGAVISNQNIFLFSAVVLIQSLIHLECGVNLSKVSLLSSSAHIPSRSKILLLHFCINCQECQQPKLLPHNNLQSPPPDGADITR